MIGGLVTLIIYLLVIGILIALIWYVLDAIPIPEPINRIIKIAVIVICCLVIILLLLSMIGAGGSLQLPKIGS
jgi:hypothetical protein